jgi:Protein of unknown function (DUF3486)
MASPFKVETDLKPDELKELQQFVREKNGTRTTQECHEWLLARGFTISFSATGGWLAKFRGDLSSERFAASGEIASSIMATARGQGVVAISDATALQLQNMIFERSLSAQNDEEIEGKELLALSMAFKTVVAGKRGVEQLKKEIAEAVAIAEKQASEGKSATDVVAVIKQTLGIS